MTRCYRCLDDGYVPMNEYGIAEFCDCKVGLLMRSIDIGEPPTADMLAVSKADMDEEAYLVSAVAALDSPDTRSP